MTVWELVQVRKSWQVGRWPQRQERLALDGVSLSIEAGERIAVVGPSGSGKTTLVRCGLGLVEADSGSISLFGQDTTAWSATHWRRLRHHAQLLFQDPRAMLHPHVPVGALLADSAALHRRGQDADAEARRALAEVGLEGRSDALPRELSGGEQRRVGLARVLMAKPRLLVADEPTAGLDAATKPAMLELLLDRVGPDCAVVLVSHDVATIARYCSRILVMDQGRLVEAFETSDLRTRWVPEAPCTAALLEAAGWTAAGEAP